VRRPMASERRRRRRRPSRRSADIRGTLAAGGWLARVSHRQLEDQPWIPVRSPTTRTDRMVASAGEARVWAHTCGDVHRDDRPSISINQIVVLAITDEGAHSWQAHPARR
jgi:hypothetical protein